VVLNRVDLHCRIDGPVQAHWLVFSNALMTDLAVWDGQVAAFGPRYRILRYDQRGHGSSSVPRNDCTFDQLVDDLAGLLERFGVTEATLAGVSLGGVTALGLAARHPTRIARVAICDCQAVSTATGAAAWEERIGVARAGGMAALVELTIGRWFRPEFVSQDPPALTRVRTMIAATPLDGFVRAARALQHYDFRPELATLHCPTACIVGAADGALPAVVRAMAEACHGATFTEIGDSGHLPNIEQPARFNAARSALLAVPPNRS
jgi:3-oxoadipate enol-lactonase